MVNPNPHAGLSSSLSLASTPCRPDRRALILLVDQPTMEPRPSGRCWPLAAGGRSSPPWAEGRYGPPVLIEAEAFPLVMDLTGDIGLREILGNDRTWWSRCWSARMLPMSTPMADLERLEAETRTMTIERVGSAEVLEEERSLEATVRPRRLDEFAGQERIKENLGILIDAAPASGPSRSTTSCSTARRAWARRRWPHIVAAEMGAQLRDTVRPGHRARRRPGRHPDQAAARRRAVHRRDPPPQPPVEEILYPAMEDFVLDIVLGKGPGATNRPAARSSRSRIIGATTRLGQHHRPAARPVRRRSTAGLTTTEADLVAILHRGAGILEIPIEHDAAQLIARRSRGTPRVANRLLRRVRDYAQVRGDGDGRPPAGPRPRSTCWTSTRSASTTSIVAPARHRRQHGGGPVGLETIAATISERSETIKDVVEPYLIQAGLLARTSRGRMLTTTAWSHLGLTAPADAAIAIAPQPGLFD